MDLGFDNSSGIFWQSGGDAAESSCGSDSEADDSSKGQEAGEELIDLEDLGKMIKSMKKVSAFFICLVTKALPLSFSLQLILGLILA